MVADAGTRTPWFRETHRTRNSGLATGWIVYDKGQGDTYDASFRTLLSRAPQPEAFALRSRQSVLGTSPLPFAYVRGES